MVPNELRRPDQGYKVLCGSKIHGRARENGKERKMSMSQMDGLD
jgi:hypothetical protein